MSRFVFDDYFTEQVLEHMNKQFPRDPNALGINFKRHERWFTIPEYEVADYGRGALERAFAITANYMKSSRADVRHWWDGNIMFIAAGYMC